MRRLVLQNHILLKMVNFLIAGHTSKSDPELVR